MLANTSHQGASQKHASNNAAAIKRLRVLACATAVLALSVFSCKSVLAAPGPNAAQASQINKLMNGSTGWERYRQYYAQTKMVDAAAYSPVGSGGSVIITSNAGFRVHPVTGRGDFHNGVDLGASLNSPVYCLLDGIVTRVGWRGNLGVAVEVYHPYPNVSTIVGHLNYFCVLPGMVVNRGQQIGFAGTTGRSTGVHVHYTVIQLPSREYIDPLSFIKQVPNYVRAMRTAQGKLFYSQNVKAMPKIDRQLIDTETEDLPEENKDGKEKTPPPQSLEF